MTQAQLDLARFGMLAGRMQLKAMENVAIAMEQPQMAEMYRDYESWLSVLCDQIFTGEIRGDDAGQA